MAPAVSFFTVRHLQAFQLFPRLQYTGQNRTPAPQHITAICFFIIAHYASKFK